MVTAQFPYENRAAVEQAILAELQKILDGKLSAEEVERAKTILLSDVALNDETNSGLAQTLGFYAKVAGDYNFGLTYPDGVRAVTVDDVVNLARKYIDPQKYLELVLVPKDAKASSCARARPASSRCLDNGLQVILQPDPNTDVVAFHTLVAGGRAAESADQAGITNLTQQLLLRGTTADGRAAVWRARRPGRQGWRQRCRMPATSRWWPRARPGRTPCRSTWTCCSTRLPPRRVRPAQGRYAQEH